MLGVDFGDRRVDQAAAGFTLRRARLVVHAELGVVFREQGNVFVEEGCCRGQWVWRRDVDVVMVVCRRRRGPRCVVGVLRW